MDAAGPEHAPPPLLIHLFGPFEVRVNGRPFPRLRYQKSQSLLALLALRHGAEVEREWLAGVLWPESSERQALRNSLTDLRRALGEEAERLRAPTPHTLSLELTGAAVDVVGFDAAIGRGDAASLAEAVALYRGPLLEGCGEEWAFQEREAREQAYLRARERLAGAALACGDAVGAEGHLRAAIGVNPLGERAHRGLMQALAAGGNYAGALLTYRELRLRLHRELNAEPDPETKALFQQIRAEGREKAARGSRLAARSQDDGSPCAERPADAVAASGEPRAAHGSEATLTFLFTDIEGSTGLWEENPEGMRHALARHDALLRRTLEASGGHVFKSFGDQFCAAFDTAAEALEAALAAQRALHAGVWQETGSLRVRMALHTGAVEARQGDYFGPPLNRLARLLDAAHGGQILLSRTTADLVQDRLPEGSSLRDLGRRRLRDLTRPEQIYQLVAPDLPADFPPLRSLEAFPNNLPQPLTRFIGREDQIAEVEQALAAHRLVTLTGAGGCGKTRLALQVAARLLEGFPEGVWLVELAPLADPALIPETVATALRVREAPGQSLLQTLAEALRSREMLLVLDNCEHLVEACAHLAEELLRSCPHLRVLATSREALGIAGESHYRVPSLSLPKGPPPPDLEQLGQYEAVRLFLERAAAVLPGFRLTPANAVGVVEVCRRLDGIPLAIELAAARVNVLSVEKLNERLDDMFRLLTGGSRTALPRQQTLRALIDWSHDLLSAEERVLFRRLSVFAAGWTLEAAEAVCVGDEVEEWEVLDLLTSLVEKSLVLYEEWSGEGRYRLLETVRQYARDRLLEAGEAERLRGRHRDWFLALAERAEPELWRRSQTEWLVRLDREHDNLRAALAWSGAAGQAEEGLRLGDALGRFWEVRGYWREGREHLAGLLALPGAQARTAARAGALRVVGLLASYQGDHGTARALLEESVAIRRELGSEQDIAFGLYVLGCTATNRGDCAAARAPFEESLAISRALGYKEGIARSLMGLGWVASGQEDWQAARTLGEEGLAIFRQLGDKLHIAMSLRSLGIAARDEGLHGRARALLEESLAIERELENKRGIGHTLSWLAGVARAQGEHGEARALLEERLAICRELNYRPGIVIQNLEKLAAVAVAQAEPERAARLFGAAEALRDALGAPLPSAERSEHDRSVAAVRAALGEEAFAAAWAAGRALSLDDAVTLALEEPGPGCT